MRHATAEPEHRVNLTPMLDVVFIMLIFFVVTSTFVQEVGIDAAAPEDRLPPPPDTQNQSIVVEIRANNQLVVDRRLTDSRAIEAHLLRRVAEVPEAAVVIDAHPESSTEQLVRVMDRARRVGVPVRLMER